MKKQIEEFIDNFNQTWIKGELSQLDHLLDENVVFIAPDLKTKIEGKKHCIQSFVEYLSQASTQVFRITDKVINIWQNTSIVTIEYYVEYDLGGQTYKEKGKEFWMLIYTNECWRMTWRALVQNESQ